MPIKLFFAGDVVQTKKREKPFVDPELKAIIQECDVACCNLEGPVITNEMKKGAKIGPSLYQNDRVIKDLRESGFNLFTLANNHVMDYGLCGMKNTIVHIENEGAAYIGAGYDEKFSPFIFEKSGIKVGILNVAENGFGASIQDTLPGYAWFGSEQFRTRFKNLTAACDYVIIVCHGGAEKWEIPLPEYRDLYKSWIDQGASIVIGHHPHIPQGWEKYKEGYIFFSLGNFSFDKGLGIQDPKTICVSVCIDQKEITPQAVYTECTDKGVQLCSDTSFVQELKERCQILSTSEYLSEVNKIVLNRLDKQYEEYFAHIYNYYRGGMKQLLKTVYFRVIKHQRFSDLWFYHNICIESHYWICRRAIDLRVNGREDESFIR